MRFTVSLLGCSACLVAAASAYKIGLWGDLPYSPDQATYGIPNLVADMNANDLSFTVMDGDLKAGSTVCSDSVYTDALAIFNSLDAPAMFTPGDNEWTDCDRGAYNSLERLTFERATLFNTKRSLGKKTMKLEVQNDDAHMCQGYTPEGKINVQCVENRRWQMGGVWYVTANVPGSCNNLCDTSPDVDEFTARNAANIAWITQTFEKATEANAAAIMIISQANPGFDDSDPTRAPERDAKTLAEAVPATDGYQAWLVAVRDLTIAFDRPVVYVHGDSHYFRVDKPLLDAEGKRVAKFTRLETFGDHTEAGLIDMMWVKVDVNVRNREVFRFTPMTVASNLLPVPASPAA